MSRSWLKSRNSPNGDWPPTGLHPVFGRHGTQGGLFGFLFPRIALANLEILRQREGVKALQRLESLSDEQRQWLEEHGNRLRVNIDSDQFFEKLLRRLDIVPRRWSSPRPPTNQPGERAGLQRAGITFSVNGASLRAAALCPASAQTAEATR